MHITRFSHIFIFDGKYKWNSHIRKKISHGKMYQESSIKQSLVAYHFHRMNDFPVWQTLFDKNKLCPARILSFQKIRSIPVNRRKILFNKTDIVYGESVETAVDLFIIRRIFRFLLKAWDFPQWKSQTNEKPQNQIPSNAKPSLSHFLQLQYYNIPMTYANVMVLNFSSIFFFVICDRQNHTESRST